MGTVTVTVPFRSLRAPFPRIGPIFSSALETIPAFCIFLQRTKWDKWLAPFD